MAEDPTGTLEVRAVAVLPVSRSECRRGVSPLGHKVGRNTDLDCGLRKDILMAMKGGMKFQKMPCDRCSADRVLGSDCVECGKKSPSGEVNADVVRRRASLARVDELIVRRRAEISEFGTGIPDIDDLETSVFYFTKSVARFAENSGSPTTEVALAESVVHIEAMRDRVAAAPDLRPGISTRQAMLSTLEELQLLWPAYRATLAAPSMLEAQRLNRIGQSLLDSSGQALSENGDNLRAAQAFEQLDTANLFERTVSALSSIYPDRSVLEIAEVGSQRAASLVGFPIDSGSGAQFLILQILATACFDADRFKQVLVDATRFCRSSPLLVEVASMEGSIEGLATSNRLLMEALSAFEAIVAREQNEEALLRRLIKFHAEIYESFAGPLFAWYLLLAKAKAQPYDKLIRSNVTALAKSLGNSPQLDSWFLGRDGFLRNAANHGNSFSIDGDVVHFHLDTYERSHSVAELIDIVFSNLESLAATSWALNSALSHAAIEVPLSDSDASYAGVSYFELAKVWLGQNGFTVIRAEASENRWDFHLAGGRMTSFEVAAVLGRVNQSEADVISVSTTPEIVSSIDVAWAAILELGKSDADGFESIGAALRLRRACTTNGRSIVTRRDLEIAVAVLGIHLLDGEHSAVPGLRLATSMSREFGYLEIADQVDRVFRAFRVQDLGQTAALKIELGNFISGGELKALPTADRVTVHRK